MERWLTGDFILLSIPYPQWSPNKADVCNEIEQLSVNQSMFRDPFEGYSIGVNLKYMRPQGRSFSLNMSYLENTYSKTSDNTGYLAQIVLPVNVGSSELTVLLEQFENGATASPAFYNSYQYGHNNRQGYAAGIGVDLKNPNIQFSLKFVDSKVIVANANQFDEKTIYINAGVLNDLF
ncbi:MAG: hypothetical protein R2827_02835 [Bdellovibrionales bacterium]